MASNSVDYRLSRGYSASARLNLQHFLHVKDVGYLVHPSISLKDENLRIADIGTGTAIWLIDLVNLVPTSARLDGFDISASQFPTKEWLPPNVLLHCLDIFDKIPANLHGQYDIINVRYFCLVVRDNNPTPMIDNLLKMLKPGGCLQWSEQDFANQKIITANPSITDEYFLTAKDWMESRSALKIDAFNWISTLDHSFSHHGMTNVLVARHPELPHHRDYWQDTYLMVLDEISYSMPNGELLRKLVEETQGQTPTGVSWVRGHLMFVGRKV